MSFRGKVFAFMVQSNQFKFSAYKFSTRHLSKVFGLKQISFFSLNFGQFTALLKETLENWPILCTYTLGGAGLQLISLERHNWLNAQILDGKQIELISDLLFNFFLSSGEELFLH